MKYTDEYGNKYEIRFRKARYMLGGVAIFAECREEDQCYWEPYANVTKYIHALEDENCAYLDTNNVGHLIQAMVDAGYVELTGHFTTSGWCVYPEGRFNEDWIAGVKELA